MRSNFVLLWPLVASAGCVRAAARGRRNLFKPGLAAALFVLCGAAWGGEDTRSANYVIVGCRAAGKHDLKDLSGIEFYKAGLCMGAISILREMQPIGICVPIQVTNDQARNVIVEYIDSRPARLGESFGPFAAEALRAAWPCNRQKY